MSALRATIAHALYVPEHPWRPSERPEVTLRGALGKALYDGVCVRDDRACAPCDLRARCLIPTWFEPGQQGQAARPYVLSVDGGEVVTPNEPLRVGMVWFGALPRRTAVVEALIRAGRAGLGARRVPHALARLWVHGDGAPVVVVEDDRVIGGWPDAAPLARLARLPASPVRAARVELVTPTVLPGDDPAPAAVLKAGMLRVRAVARAQGVEIDRRWPHPTGGRWVRREWVEAGRFSARRRGRQDLSGWVGEIAFGEEIAPFADLLAAMELVHAGRGSSAGAGRVRVAWEVSSRALSDPSRATSSSVRIASQ